MNDQTPRDKQAPQDKYDPQGAGAQYLEDMATAYWKSRTLFTALEAELFERLEPEGATLAELAVATGLEPAALERFLVALQTLSLVETYDDKWQNSPLARRYLVRNSPDYMGGLVEWRQYLDPFWRGLDESLRTGGRAPAPLPPPGEIESRRRRYIAAMDQAATYKSAEIVAIVARLPLTEPADMADRGNKADKIDKIYQPGAISILDIGAGSGAISAALLARYPGARATLVDIPEIIGITREYMTARGCDDRCEYLPANILEPWPETGRFTLIVLSNIVHAFGWQEAASLLTRAAAVMEPDGALVIHDFFPEHCPKNAALFDLNMLVNTYNGRVFPAERIRKTLVGLGLEVTRLLPLKSDTAVLVATHEALPTPDKTQELKATILAQGFTSVREIPITSLCVREWPELRCRFGCPSYSKCASVIIPAAKTRAILAEYRRALLIEGEPPTGDFQRKILEAERHAFRAGFYKAFAFWAGPCSLCAACSFATGCASPHRRRPSLEAAGIDVFATVQDNGESLRVVADGDYVKYFGAILLE